MPNVRERTEWPIVLSPSFYSRFARIELCLTFSYLSFSPLEVSSRWIVEGVLVK